MVRSLVVRNAIASAVLLAVAALAAYAQGEPFGGYTKPDRFIIGGYDLNRPLFLDIADSIGLFVTADYHSVTDFNDTAYDTGADTLYRILRDKYRHNDTATRMLVMFAPDILETLTKHATNLESYPGADGDVVHVVGFEELPGWEPDTTFGSKDHALTCTRR